MNKYDFSKLKLKDLQELKVFRNSFIWVILVSITVLCCFYATFVWYESIRTTMLFVTVFMLGVVYRGFFNVYVHNYKAFRFILDKAKVK